MQITEAEYILKRETAFSLILFKTWHFVNFLYRKLSEPICLKIMKKTYKTGSFIGID
jgi:hypothetical protein